VKDSLSTILNAFEALQPREKLFLKAGGALVALALVAMLLLPSIEKYQQLAYKKNSLAADMTWLVEQRELVRGLSNGCPKLSQSDANQKVNLSNIAKRNQLKVENIIDNNESFLISVSGGEGNKFLKSIYQIACQGYIFKTINIDADDDQLTTLKAKFEVQRVK
jgi:type II secretory pathway component PulM